RLLHDLAALPASRLRIIMTFMEASPGARAAFTRRRGPAGFWLRAVGEPFQWGAPRNEVAAMLERHSFRMLALAGEPDLARIWPGPILEGEVLALAQRASPFPTGAIGL